MGAELFYGDRRTDRHDEANSRISKFCDFFLKIRSMGAELFYGDRRTNRHDEANSRISKFCESA
jgi:hypothetical protein